MFVDLSAIKQLLHIVSQCRDERKKTFTFVDAHGEIPCFEEGRGMKLEKRRLESRSGRTVDSETRWIRILTIRLTHFTRQMPKMMSSASCTAMIGTTILKANERRRPSMKESSPESGGNVIGTRCMNQRKTILSVLLNQEGLSRNRRSLTDGLIVGVVVVIRTGTLSLLLA